MPDTRITNNDPTPIRNQINNNVDEDVSNSSLTSASTDLTQNTLDNIAFIKLQGKLNRALGFATGIAASEEAQGQAFKNRAEASKQMV